MSKKAGTTMNTFAEVRLDAFFDELEKIGSAKARLAGTVASGLSGGLTGAGFGAATGALAAEPGERGRGAAQGALVGGATGLIGGGILGGALNTGTRAKQLRQAIRTNNKGVPEKMRGTDRGGNWAWKRNRATETLQNRVLSLKNPRLAAAGFGAGHTIGAGGALVAAPIVAHKATKKNKEE